MNVAKLGLSIVVALWVIGCSGPAPAGVPGKPSAAAGAGAGAAPGAYAELDQLYEKARPEGRVVAYFQTPEEYAGLKAAFEKRYPGITVEIIGGRGVEQLTRLYAEHTSGQHVADIVGGGGSTMLEIVQNGFFIPWRPVDADKLIPGASLDDDRHWIYTLNVYGMLVNTRLVPADKVPSKREDLHDPWWRGEGKLLLDDPRAQGGGQSFLVISYRDLGRDFLDKLAAQRPTWSRDRANSPVQVARGEFAGYAPQNVGQDTAKLERSAPVKLVFFRDGTYYTEITVGILNRAPHPNAARLWANYMFTEEGQRALAESGLQYVARLDVPGPAGYPKLEDLQLTTRTREERERNDEYVRIFNDVFFR